LLTGKKPATNMKSELNMAVFVLGVLIFTGAARATGMGAESNPYGVIFQHSVFGLVPPQPPAAVNTATAPPDIIVNGVMNIFGRKYALFKSQTNKGKSYLLGEGQSNGEIELLSVDERAGEIKISNHGIIQTIALAKPPAPSGAPISAAPGVAPASAADNDTRQVLAEAVLLSSTENNNPAPAAAPVAPAGYAVMGAGHSGDSQGGSSGSQPPSSDASGPQSSGGSSSTPRPEPDPWWVIGSKSMEAARIATANMVNSGQAEPWPLTPFTPPGTPANLIGSDRLYFGHGVYQGLDSGTDIGVNRDWIPEPILE
jgi:hypothetical protein